MKTASPRFRLAVDDAADDCSAVAGMDLNALRALSATLKSHCSEEVNLKLCPVVFQNAEVISGVFTTAEDHGDDMNACVESCKGSQATSLSYCEAYAWVKRADCRLDFETSSLAYLKSPDFYFGDCAEFEDVRNESILGKCIDAFFHATLSDDGTKLVAGKDPEIFKECDEDADMDYAKGAVVKFKLEARLKESAGKTHQS
jgi:hypothetical protein